MTSVIYKDHLILSYAEFDDATNSWSASMQVTLRIKEGNSFKTKEEAESAGIKVGKTWVEKNSS
ncbi:MAG: hypothetical protein ACREO5_05825 [Candidatus Binatia bacterium]